MEEDAQGLAENLETKGTEGPLVLVGRKASADVLGLQEGVSAESGENEESEESGVPVVAPASKATAGIGASLDHEETEASVGPAAANAAARDRQETAVSVGCVGRQGRQRIVPGASSF